MGQKYRCKIVKTYEIEKAPKKFLGALIFRI